MAIIEFASTGEGQYKPLPDGSYDIQITNAEQTTSKKGNDQLKVSAVVSGGSYDGKKVTLFYSMLPQSGFKLEKLLDAAGVDYEVFDIDTTDGAPGKGFRLDTDNLIGTYVRFNDVTQSTWEGKVNNRWDGEAISPLSEVAEAPATTAAIAKPAIGATATPGLQAGMGVRRERRRVEQAS